MLTNYRDINYELTRQNQQMRIELSKYRNEIIKMREDLMKQREENALLKNNLTSEFLKVSQSFNVIFQLLENANDETLNETIKDLSNSINNLNNTSYAYEKSNKINTTIASHKRENMGQNSVIGKDSSINDTSLSNFSFEVENEETTITEPTEMQISIQESEPEFVQNKVSDESIIEQNGMSIIEEETYSESKIEQSIRCNNNEVQEAISPNNSSIEEESFMSLKPGLFRSTSIIPNRITDTLSPSKIPLRNCSVLLTRSTLSNIMATSITLKDEQVTIYSKENVENINSVKDENIEDELEPDKKISRTSTVAKSLAERRPRRKAAPTVLVEQNSRLKLRRN